MECGEVGLEEGEGVRGGLVGNDPASGPDKRGKGDGKDADVCADVNDGHAGRDEEAGEAEFVFKPIAGFLKDVRGD